MIDRNESETFFRALATPLSVGSTTTLTMSRAFAKSIKCLRRAEDVLRKARLFRGRRASFAGRRRRRASTSEKAIQAAVQKSG